MEAGIVESKVKCSCGTMKKGKWYICINSYEIDGVRIPKGRMKYHSSERPILNADWRTAKLEEIENRKIYKGNEYCLLFV